MGLVIRPAAMACCLLARARLSSQTLRDRPRFLANLVKQGSLAHQYVKPLRTARQATLQVKAGQSDVLLLDFDGVIVDSEPEVRLWRCRLACCCVQ